MPSPAVVHFPPFRLDLTNEQLWRGNQLLPLRPKPFAILRYLVERPGQLVTKEELLKAIWPQTYVSEGLLHTYLRDLRHVLGDNPESPRFIETVVRRGYRFIAPLSEETTSESPPSKVRHGETTRAKPSVLPATPLPTLVGREAALTSLQSRLAQAQKGLRQVVFVTGEPGIGKTTLVDAFLEQVSTRQEVWIGRGQCVGQYGAGEAYLPILEALGRLGREPGGEQLRTVFRRQAPSWLTQLPTLLADGELEAWQREVHGVTRERMLRELAEVLEVLTTERLLVLVLEDLHWSDVATVDFLTAVAQRREPARLLLLGTYRPADVIVSGHPLKTVKEELQLHKQCTELPLTLFTEGDTIRYLIGRFSQHQFLDVLGQVLHQHTEGNPLFLVTTVEDLVTRQVIGEREGQWQLRTSLKEIALGAPTSVQQLIIRQLERLTTQEQGVLEVASVVGESFSTAAVAAGLETDLEQVETCCESLARREQFLQAQELGTWPDGTLAGRYRFVHALYQQVVYERIGVARRVQLHRRIGERLETGYGEQVDEIAAELAVHFEQGRDYRRAVRYREQAGKNATRRSAHIEAIHHVTKGLELLKTLPDTLERTQHELTLQLALGTPLIATKGYTVPEVEKAYRRALELCRKAGETPQLFLVLGGLSSFYGMRGELQTARELVEQRMRLAQSLQDPVFLLDAYRTLGMALFWLGEFASARAHLEQSITLYTSQRHSARSFLSLQEPKVHCLSFTAWALWFLGYPDQARERISEALALTEELPPSYTQAWALIPCAEISQHRREEQLTLERAEAAITLATDLGFPPVLAMGTILQGWALAEHGQGEKGIVQIRRGMTAERTAGVELQGPYCRALLAEAYRKVGQIEESLTVLAEALAMVNKNAERWYEAELYRLKGELTRQQEYQKSQGKRQKSLTLDPRGEAEACFLKAIAIARQQQAKSLELRAVTSLSRLRLQQDKKQEAHQMLSEIYSWFTEGFDTKDLQEAKALLAQFSES